MQPVSLIVSTFRFWFILVANAIEMTARQIKRLPFEPLSGMESQGTRSEFLE